MGAAARGWQVEEARLAALLEGSWICHRAREVQRGNIMEKKG